MGFATKWKTKKICAKEWSKKYVFLSHFFIFHHKPKRMLKFLRNSFWIVIVQKIQKKVYAIQVKCIFLFLVTWHWAWYDDVKNWTILARPLWVLSKFGPIEAYMCRVIASWLFPSNGIKRYFNGPLSRVINKNASNVSCVLIYIKWRFMELIKSKQDYFSCHLLGTLNYSPFKTLCWVAGTERGDRRRESIHMYRPSNLS